MYEVWYVFMYLFHHLLCVVVGSVPTSPFYQYPISSAFITHTNKQCNVIWGRLQMFVLLHQLIKNIAFLFLWLICIHVMILYGLWLMLAQCLYTKSWVNIGFQDLQGCSQAGVNLCFRPLAEWTSTKSRTIKLTGVPFAWVLCLF